MDANYGYIYTVNNRVYNGEFMKFGFTKDPHSRLNTYKSSSPYPFYYHQLYKITHVPEDYRDFIEHDKVIEIVLGSKGHGYSLELFNKGGGCEFITGNYDEVKYIMESFGYKLEESNLDDIEVEKPSKKSLNKSLSTTLRERLGLEEVDDGSPSNAESERHGNRMEIREYQDRYVEMVLHELKTHNKCVMKAPTGAGKTFMFYRILHEMSSDIDICVMFSPRRTLNKQNVSQKYVCNVDSGYNIFHYSDSNSNRDADIVTFLKDNKKCIISSCIHSAIQLQEVLKDSQKHPNMVIIDECHCIENWVCDERYNYWLQSPLIHNRLYASATLTETFLKSSFIFGNLVEEIKAYELIKQGYLCNIDTITKHTTCDVNDVVNNKHSIIKMTADAFTNHNKNKGMVFVSKQETAIRLYKQWNVPSIKPFICISNSNIQLHCKGDDDINMFDAYQGKAIVISCEMLVMGYDNPRIDLIVFADPTQSDVKLRQIVGRGLRKDPSNPCKVLHCLLPIYQNEPEPYSCYLKYLYYLVSECGKDVVTRNGVLVIKDNENSDADNAVDIEQIDRGLHEGDGCPLTVWQEYCTNKHKSYIELLEFLKGKRVHTPEDYMKVQRECDWLPILTTIKKTYPMFAFQDLDVHSHKYYATKEECIKAYEECKRVIEARYGDMISELTEKEYFSECLSLDDRLPNIDIMLYYY